MKGRPDPYADMPTTYHFLYSIWHVGWENWG